MKLSTPIIQALESLKIESLNPMQEASIDTWKEGKDLILLSPTGSGKTLAYLLPLLESLNPEIKGVQAVVLVPSRELALQIDEARHTEVKTSELNKILNEAIVSHPPAGLKNTRPKPKYIVQTDTCPPWFVVHGHELGLLHWSWKRFLERKIREKYPFVGTPIMFSFRNDSK